MDKEFVRADCVEDAIAKVKEGVTLLEISILLLFL